MIVTAALCWWNERPEDLERCVRAMANVADRVVALDGSYARYPHATPRSSDAEVDVIWQTAKSVGLDCLVLQPDRLWAGQVEKRSYLLAMATLKSDWVVVVDADHIIQTDRNQIRAFLESASGDVYAAIFVTPVDPDRPPEESSVGEWHLQQTRGTLDIPHIFRALPGMRVERVHWYYSAIKNGQRHWIYGDQPDYPAIAKQPIGVPYIVEHRTMFRTAEQIRASRAFLNDRDKVLEQTGQEDDRPDLPRPVFDYSRGYYA